MKNIEFSLILPCYNEGPTFEASVKKIVNALKGKKYEIIFVEDKSTDNTDDSVRRLVKSLKNAKAIFHKKNLGRGKSVTDGIYEARANICGFMDVDCEISPTYVPVFVKEVKKGADLVVGKRFYEKGLGSLSRLVTSKVYAYLVRKVLNLPIEDTETGYKFFNKNSIVKIVRQVKDKGWFWDTEICARANMAKLTIVEIPVLFIRRPDKKSTVRILPDSINYLKKLIDFRKSFQTLNAKQV